MPNADVEEGHRSTLLAQYANISLRLGGEKLVIDPKTEQVVDNIEAARLLRRSVPQCRNSRGLTAPGRCPIARFFNRGLLAPG
ncbi:MAG: hypothetical protein KKE86_01810 [Planctomycetes bacterium]|nr:hypothetical protein [Planctomycetota bacterium]MBU4398050.1 hypothetical protein [Planctomycetota bacterium]MCG2682848.1 hypothetical protein [Planctomycetales bacterium]